MKIARIICLIGTAAFSLFFGQSAAYADSFGLGPDGNYFLGDALSASHEISASLEEEFEIDQPPLNLNRIITYSPSDDGYYLGAWKTLFGGNSSSGSSSGGFGGGSSGTGNTLGSIFNPLGSTGGPGGSGAPGGSNGNWTGPSNAGGFPPVGGFIAPSQSLTTSPVVTPEPGSLLLLGIGIVTFGLLRYRLNRRQKSK